MKYIITILTLTLVITACSDNGASEEIAAADSTVSAIDSLLNEKNDTPYDSVYAAELGADDYGMKPYVMALLKSGPNRDLDSAANMELQMAHLDNIKRLATEGKLVLAGPFMYEGELRGIYVFDVETLEEAEELTNSDPAIQAGSLVMELIPWYGSAALMEVNEIHTKVAKILI